VGPSRQDEGVDFKIQKNRADDEEVLLRVYLVDEIPEQVRPGNENLLPLAPVYDRYASRQEDAGLTG
jgi:hypothetical protein